MVLRFGDVTVDLDGREVVRAGEPRHLEPQAFDLLAHLINESARIVSKEELLDEVWGDQFVSESALTTRIKEIRQALGDDGARQAIIKNVRGRGYRFVASLAPVGDERRATTPVLRVSIVGRDDDLATTDELLGDAPVVTLVGPGGVGKTTLALSVADRVAHRFGDGVVFADLSMVSDPMAVVPCLMRAASLANPNADGDEALAALGRLDSLVVLDNCEHVIDAAATVVDRLLHEAGPVRLLATSRERLGVAGEQVLPVASLGVEAARELFFQRARAAQPGLSIAEDEVALLDDLLDAVDRLPLAIEMAAARSSAIGVADLVPLIKDRVAVLRSPSPTVSERHRTLGAVVAWSEELLSDDERGVFVDLSVFTGAVAADDVVGVLAEPGAEARGRMIDLLARLADRSLVTADVAATPTTYRMLETVKAYSASRRADTLVRRHAQWFCDVAAEADRDLRTPQERRGHDRIEGVAPEFRAAHRWARGHDQALAARLGAALQLHGHSRFWGEPAMWARELASVMSDSDPFAPDVWGTLAADASFRGDFDSARRLGELALESDDPRTKAAALESLTDVALYEGSLDESRRHATELLRFGEAVGDLHAVATAVTNQALSWAYGGDRDRALAALAGIDDRQALAPSDRAWLAYSEGEVIGAEDPERALQAFEAAIDLAAQGGSLYVAGVARLSLTSLRARTGDPAAAVAAFERILRDYRRTGNLTHGITALRNLIDLLVRIDEDETAMVLLGAVSSEQLNPTFGEEQQRLEAAQRTVESRAGVDRTGAWMASGDRRGAMWALETALEKLGALS